MDNFVIIYPSRSGSSYLRYTLNTHPCIVCLGDVLDQENYILYTVCFGKYQMKREDYLKVCKIVALRARDNFSAQFGFKLSYINFFRQKNMTQTINPNSYKIVHIYRDNLFDRSVSIRLMEKTGEWIDLGDNEESSYNKVKLTIDRQRLRDEMEKYLQMTQGIRQIFSKDYEYVELTYEDLIANSKVIQDVQRFLGVECLNLHSPTKKQNKRQHKEIIINYEELRDLEKKYASCQKMIGRCDQNIPSC